MPTVCLVLFCDSLFKLQWLQNNSKEVWFEILKCTSNVFQQMYFWSWALALYTKLVCFIAREALSQPLYDQNKLSSFPIQIRQLQTVNKSWFPAYFFFLVHSITQNTIMPCIYPTLSKLLITYSWNLRCQLVYTPVSPQLKPTLPTCLHTCLSHIPQACS